MHIETTPAEFAELLATTAAQARAEQRPPLPSDRLPLTAFHQGDARHLQERLDAALRAVHEGEERITALEARLRLTPGADLQDRLDAATRAHQDAEDRAQTLESRVHALRVAADRREQLLRAELAQHAETIRELRSTGTATAQEEQPGGAPVDAVDSAVDDPPPPGFEVFERPKPGPPRALQIHVDGRQVAAAAAAATPQLTPAQRDERTALVALALPTLAAAEAAQEQPAPRRAAPTRTLPRAVGDPGANIGDGLDVWRIDGRYAQAEARRAAIAAGATPEEAAQAGARSPLDHALLMERLEEIRADGRISNAMAALGAILGRRPDSLTAVVTRAVHLGVAGGGSPGGVGPGGKGTSNPHRLTDYGRQLLAEYRTGQLAEDATATEEVPEGEPAEADLPPLDTPPPPLEPTAEQQAAIDALNAENARHVARTRIGPEKPVPAKLPLRTRPVTNRYLPKDLRKPAAAARRAGWAIGVGRSGHIEWHGPDGQLVRTAATPSTQGSINHAHRDLRGAGISW